MDDGCSENFTEICRSLYENGTSPEAQSRYPMGMWIEICLYSLAFLVGGPLNVMSMWKLLRARRTLKHPSAILLLRLHLNVADLITLFIYIPKQIIWLFTYAWYGGDVLCRMLSFISTFCFYLHSFVIACIAIDRLFGAWHINSISASRKVFARVSQLLIAAWLMATILALPQTLIFQLYELEDTTFGNPSKQCASFWMKFKYDSQQIFRHPNVSVDEKNRVARQLDRVMLYERCYTIAHLVFNFVLPMLLIIFSYTTLLFILKGFIKETGNNGQMNSLLVLTRKHYTSEDENSKVTGTTCVMHEVSSIRRNSNPPPSTLDRAATPRGDLHDERNGGHFDHSAKRVSSPFVFANDHSGKEEKGWVRGRNDRGTVEKFDHGSCLDAKDHLSMINKNDGGEISQNSDDFLRPPKKAKKPHRAPVSPFAIGKITKARKEAKRQAALILLAYVICWSPYNVLSIVYATGLFGDAPQYDFLNGLIAINPIVNPIIYGVFKKGHF